MTSVVLMDPGFYARRLTPDDPDPLLCVLDSLLVFEDRATAEAHQQILQAQADPAGTGRPLDVLRVAGLSPATTTGWRLGNEDPAPTAEVKRQVASLNAAVYSLCMASTPSMPPPGMEA